MEPHIAPTATERSVTRRRLIQLAGLGGIGAAAGTLLASPPATVAAQDATPEAFLSDAFALRIRAMNTGDARYLAGVYDDANPTLQRHERERAAFFHGGLAARWDGTTLLFDSTVSLIALNSSAAEVTARLYEWIRVQWIQNVHPIDPVMRENMRKDPDRYVSRLTRGPRGEIVTGMGFPHEVTLTRHGPSWRIARDQYDEFYLYGHSPDLVPGSWASLETPPKALTSAVPDAPNGWRLPHFAALTPRPLAAWSYARNSAVNYANGFCDPNAGHPYNSTYCDFSCAGGDCANFVSQCFYSGTLPTDASWYSTYTSCGTGCGPATAVKGSGTWIQNASLRQWVLSTNKGVDFGTDPASINNMGYGDVINYDWHYPSGLAHITIVVSPGNQSTALIDSHTFDACGLVWHAGYGPCGCWVTGYNVKYYFTALFNGGS